MTVINPHIGARSRYFPSKIVLVAAGELIFIALMLRWSDSPAFFAGAIACSLGAIQLGAVLINRFQRDTQKVRKAAEAAQFSSQAVLITDPNGRIKWANTRFTDLTGFGMSDSAGKTFSMLLHGQNTDTPTVELIRNQMRSEQPFAVEILQYNRAFKEFWVSSKGEPFHDARGQLTHYVITQNDLSNQRRQTREIQQLADAIVIDRAVEPEAMSPVALESEHPVNDPALRLAQQLESLSSADDRAQLQQLVDGLKTRFEECVTILPVENIASHATNHND